MHLTSIAAVAVFLASVSSASAACDSVGARSARARCADAKRFEPYDPDRAPPRARAGRITSGNTEFRIGGRSRFDYQLTR